MNNWWAPKKQRGFTIVEIIIVIVVIGILGAIVSIAYIGIQSRALDSNARTDLTNAAKLMNIAKSFDGTYPTTLPPDLKSSNNISLSLVVSSHPYYGSLTNVQNGVLLSQICQNLIDAGQGNGINAGGLPVAYITGCGNWNDDSMQITGWKTEVFPTPITANTFSDYAATVPPGGAWFPTQQAVIRDFYTQLNSRFLAQGGSYPIESFWDSWANPGNGGVMLQPLPAPQPSGNANTYCIQATAGTKTWNVRPSSTATSGSC